MSKCLRVNLSCCFILIFVPLQVDKLSVATEKPVSPKVSEPILKPEMLLTNSPPPLPEKSHGNDNMFCFRRAKKRRRLTKGLFICNKFYFLLQKIFIVKRK